MHFHGNNNCLNPIVCEQTQRKRKIKTLNSPETPAKGPDMTTAL
jgi:hypothetical protein